MSLPNLPSIEQRAQTLEELFSTMANYSKDDLKLTFNGGAYSVSPPPWSGKAVDEVGTNYFNSRYFLLSDYFIFLTEWTDNKSEQRKKRTTGFLKAMVSEMASELTVGISGILEGIVEHQFMNVLKLNKKALPMFLNPWSIIFKLEEIKHIEILSHKKFLMTMTGIHVQADTKYEGLREGYFHFGENIQQWSTVFEALKDGLGLT